MSNTFSTSSKFDTGMTTIQEKRRNFGGATIRAMQKTWTSEFLSGHPLELCQYVKKHLCWNFGKFGQKLEVTTELWNFNGKTHCKQALSWAVGV